eukprot:6191376-Pyramimonas_sp.AAC.1
MLPFFSAGCPAIAISPCMEQLESVQNSLGFWCRARGAWTSRVSPCAFSASGRHGPLDILTASGGPLVCNDFLCRRRRASAL